MEIITKETYQERFPNFDGFDINEMNNQAQSFYFTLYSLYMDYFYQFLIKNTNILEYDNKLKEKGFVKVDEKRMDFYQKFSKRYLNYFYIRNNIHVNRLDKNFVDVLEEKIKTRNFEYDDNVNQLIESTYKKIIYESVRDNKEIVNISYGPDSLKFYSPNNALVLGVRVQNNIDFSKQNEIKEYLDMLPVIEKICLELEKELRNVFKINTRVILYNDSSVKKEVYLNLEGRKINENKN